MKTKGDKFKMPYIQRIILILAGMSNFLLGYAVYLCIKDDKDKQEQAEFINRGASFAFAFVVLYGIVYVAWKIAKMFI